MVLGSRLGGAPIHASAVTDVCTAEGALEEFYGAFNNRDLELIERNWELAGNPVMNNPLGGVCRGWGAIRPVYARIFQGDLQVQVEFRDYSIEELGDVFVAIGREHGQARKQGHTVDLLIRTTRVFRRLNGRWRQFHHHGSIDDPDMLHRYKSLATVSV